jgi:hypothetical protein
MNILTYRAREADAVTLIGAYIDRGLAPWKSGGAKVFVMQPSLTRPPGYFFTVGVQIKLLPDLVFEYDVAPGLHGEMEMAYEVAERAFEFYRNRPILPVDDHIVLGED